MSDENEQAYKLGYQDGLNGNIIDGPPTYIAQNPSLHESWLEGFKVGQLERLRRVNNGLYVL